VSTVEEHGGGRQMFRVQAWPRFSWLALMLIPLFAFLAVLAGFDHAYVACAALALIAVLLLIRSLLECGTAIRSVRCAVEDGLHNDNS
jgi:uncharacterized membrane protein HdeD (DUF308 family)